MTGASPAKVDALNAQWRAQRAAPLSMCQAARSDGECYHKKCPQNIADNRKSSCPLPWVWDMWDNEEIDRFEVERILREVE